MTAEHKKLILRLVQAYLFGFFAFIGIGVIIDTFLFHEIPTRESVTSDIFISFFLAFGLLFINRDVWKERVEEDDEFNASEVKS